MRLSKSNKLRIVIIGHFKVHFKVPRETGSMLYRNAPWNCAGTNFDPVAFGTTNQ